jgi:heme/copper-type cytochrome/quinol oxidase subunit 1
VPAHYHASLGGITSAFMAATYLLLERLGRSAGDAQAVEKRWIPARRQLMCFGVGQAVFALGFAIGGVYGLGRKAYAGEQHVRSLGEQIGLGVMGLGGLVAAAGGVWFLFLVLRPLLARRR